MPRTIAFAFACALVGASAPAAAQIVNVQSLLADEPPEGLSGSITASADWRTGNTNLLALAAAPLVRFRSGDHVALATWRGELRQNKSAPDADFTTIVKKSFAHVRYRYRVRPRVVAEAFGQHVFDEFRRLRLRVVAGAGPKFDVVATGPLRLSVAVAYMIEIEELNDGYIDPDNDPPSASGIHHRASSYVVASYHLDDRVTIANTMYAQPRLDDPSDIRMLDDLALVVKLGDSVAITTALSLSYDSHPPTDDPTDPDPVSAVEAFDSALSSSLTVSF